MTKIYLLLFISFPFLFNKTVNAQEDTSGRYSITELKAMSLEQLLNITVTTASGKEQKLMDAPSMIGVVFKEDIEKMGVTSLIDVLKYLPFIETSIGSDGEYRVDIRGVRKYGNILVLINGLPANNFYDGRSVYDFPVDLIDKIEIITGPNSAIFGTNAVVGVINIFTVKSENSVTGSIGTNNTFMQNFNYSAVKKKSSFSIMGGFLQSDGANEILEKDAKSDETWSLTYGDKSASTNRWIKDLYFGTNLEINKLKINFFGINRNRGSWAGPLFIATKDSHIKSGQMIFSASYEFKLNSKLTITPKIYGNIIDNDFSYQEAPANYLSAISGDLFKNGKITNENYTAVTSGAEIHSFIKINNNFDIINGIIIENQFLPQYDLQRNYQITGDIYFENFGNYDNVVKIQNNKSRTVFSEYFQGNYRFNKLDITAGFRFDSYSDFGQTVNPRIGIIYKPLNSLHFKGLFARAFRAPTFKELYDNTSIGNEYGVRGNDELKPETISTVEFSAEFIKRKIYLRLTSFYSENDNLIEIYDPNGNGGIGEYRNIGNTKNKGYATDVIWKISENLNFTGNFSQYFNLFEWDSTAVRRSFVVYLNKGSKCDRYLLNSPSIRANAGLFFNYSRFEVFAGGNYRNKSENNKRFYLEDERFIEIPAYFQGNFSIGYRFKNNLNIRISANNIGKKYSDPDESTNINVFGTKGMIQPGKTYLLTVNYKF